MGKGSKAKLRQQMIEYRSNHLSRTEWEHKSALICQRLLDRKEVRQAERLLAFAPVNREVDLFDFFKVLPETVDLVLPRIEGDHLVAVAIDDRTAFLRSLEKDKVLEGFRRETYGILEPTRQAGEQVDPSTLDLVLVPGLAFDQRGHRVGYGEGFYDRLLSTLPSRTVTIGICFSGQLVEEDLPVEPHDQAVDRVVTEEGME